ncbi:MAG: lysozyme inhibitor LprI family protein [Oceanicaulis sp.]|nr:lysozyme inhibitor LprI family protein [Oceanicaulis sp.]
MMMAMSTHAQPRAVTDDDRQAIEKAIDTAVESLGASYRQGRFLNAKDSLYLQYAADTIRVNTWHRMQMDIDYSTSGMVQYTEVATREYDTLLNSYYRLLMNKLPTEDQAILRQAQRSWITYRDAEFALNERVRSYNDHGSMHVVMKSGSELHFVKDRVNELYHYLRMLTEYEMHMRNFIIDWDSNVNDGM